MRDPQSEIVRLKAQVKKLKKELEITKALVYSKDMQMDPKVTGSEGGKKRMNALTLEQRRALAMKGVEARRKNREAK